MRKFSAVLGNNNLFYVTLMILTLTFSCSKDTLLTEYVPENKDEKEIRSLLIQYQDAKNRFNLEQFLSCLHDQGRYSFRGAMISKGKLKKLFPGFWAELKSGNPAIYPITHEFVTGDYFLSGQLMNPQITVSRDTAKITTRFTSGWWSQRHYISMLRDNEQWLINQLDWEGM